MEGSIKQWFSFVKPNFHKYVEPQRHVAGEYCVRTCMYYILIFGLDIIIPRSIENKVAISMRPFIQGLQFPVLISSCIIGMISDRIHKTLAQKSRMHQEELKRLGKIAEDAPLSSNVIVLHQGRQVVGINTLILNPATPRDDFIFYFDRMAALLVERCASVSIVWLVC